MSGTLDSRRHLGWTVSCVMALFGSACRDRPHQPQVQARPAPTLPPATPQPPAASRPTARPGPPVKPLPGWLAPYQPVARRIVRHAQTHEHAWNRLLAICDDIGPRLVGSAANRRAVDWAMRTLRAEGFANVRAEKVLVPGWVRGRESLTLLAPRRAELPLLGIGLSVGTPPGGITAPVVVVSGKGELKRLGPGVRGKIVLFNHVMPPYDPKQGTGYGKAAYYRVHGASLAAKQGAVAALVRSVTAHSLRTPHTGMMEYDKGVPRIPVAAVTVEDAALMARFQKRGIPVRVRLEMGARNLGNVPASNVLAELTGTQKPDEYVLIGCHLDSWDTGTGAHDDGVGCAMAMAALTTIRELKLRPRRTVRLVLWTAEELGLLGAKRYAKEHAAELSRHVAGIEADAGGFRFTRLGYELSKKGGSHPDAVRRLGQLLRLVAPLGKKPFLQKDWSGADLVPLRERGILLLGLITDVRHYFDVHHSPADTVDKIDPRDLRDSTAAMAVLAYVLADLPFRFLPAAPRPSR
ncbi:MAG: M20/M25/M40 family metallo-hydrolase [bacterium]